MYLQQLTALHLFNSLYTAGLQYLCFSKITHSQKSHTYLLISVNEINPFYGESGKILLPV